MNCKKSLVPTLVITILLLATCGNVVESTTGTWTVYDLEYAGLKVRIEAPRQANPGENITVTVRSEAPQRIYVEYVYIKIYGLRNETDDILLETITHLQSSFLTAPHEDDYTVAIPNRTCPGFTHGTIECEWEFMGAPAKIPSAGFMVTYVRNTELEQLRAEYDELNATYHSLLTNYTELDSEYVGELGGARNLMYVFIATTAIAVATLLYLILRKPKTYWS